MRKRIIALILVIAAVICLGACTKTTQGSTFSIQFIDVGQGDSALVECDGHYMLIDGGEITAGDKVYSVLEEKRIQRLDYLVISHLHTDHYGGLIKALSYASKIGKTLSNADYTDNERFRKLEHQLSINGSAITVPHVGDTFMLGSAEIEVVDVASAEPNDSLVILITYGETKFLFTGDIGENAQRRVFQKYRNDADEPYKINLIKMPHHGAEVLILFVETFMPDFAVISVGQGNIYRHPRQTTLDMLDQADVKVYRTDQDGDITVKSDGKTLTIETSR